MAVSTRQESYSTNAEKPLSPIVQDSSNIDRKVTPVVVDGPKEEQEVSNAEPIVQDDFNVLHGYRSVNYLFTLAAVPTTALENPESIRQAGDYFIIARSAGKPVNAIDPEKADPEAKTMVEGFNEKSSGRFDLFLNGVEIETLMAFSNTTNLTMATSIAFEVYEPLSINGFMEALQVSAMAAGHLEYMSAPFMLKMEFVGYSDEENGPSTRVVRLDERATRYFIMSITKVEVDMTENGTRYRCSAVAHNEMGFGSHNKLNHPIKMEGQTVGEILQSLEVGLNNSAKASAETDQKDKDGIAVYDKYEIRFPTRVGTKYDYDSVNELVYNAKIIEDFSSPAMFSFADPGEAAFDAYQQGLNVSTGAAFRLDSAGNIVKMTDAERQKFTQNVYDTNRKPPKYNPAASGIQFAAGANVPDIIASVIRDSTFGKNIIKDKKVEDQMVDYVHVAIETIPLNKWNPVTLRPAFLYRYLVLPYKMHYSRIPMFQKDMTEEEQDALKTIAVKRRYDYLYTGKNLDIKRFNLRFNTLFYQAYPQGMGNALFSNPNKTYGEARNGEQITSVSDEEVRNRIIPKSRRVSDPAAAAVNKEGGTGQRRDYYTYDALVTTMHQAILDNLDMVTCELEILGDPYFLCTGGIGNYRPEIVSLGMTANGEAPYQSNDIIISVDFRTPDDYGSKLGEPMSFTKTPFSGCFRVIKVNSKFSDGMFTQRLQLVRVPGQPEERSGVIAKSKQYASLDSLAIPSGLSQSNAVG